MRAIQLSQTGLSQTGELPQSILQVLSDARYLVLGIGTVVFLLALLILILRRRRRRRIQTDPERAEAMGVSPFEDFVPITGLDELVEMGSELYQTLGHKIRDVTHPGKDVADLIIDAKNGERWIARCLAKPTINSEEVAAFRKAIRKAGIPESALITSGSFTPQALEEAERGPIHTLDLVQLDEYIIQAKQMPLD
jgi:hypothetical protein